MKHTQEELQAIVDARNATKQFQAEARQIVAGYTQEEIETFPAQEQEAKAYVADNTSPTPMIDAIISESGEDKDELVNRIITKSNAFKSVVGKALGKKRKSATG